jgi:cyclopropane fatty-acyl-phospholipid synthase-like methyltransferase
MRTRNSLLNRLDDLKQLSGGAALDLGAGAGNDSVWMIERGFNVTSLDKDASKLRSNEALKDKATIIEQSWDEFVFTPNSLNLIVAQNTFPFLSREKAERVITDAISALQSGGFICYTLFGPKDAWAHKETMHFVSYEDAISFAEQLPVEIFFRSNEVGYGTTMSGDMKFWEVHRIILKKK